MELLDENKRKITIQHVLFTNNSILVKVAKNRFLQGELSEIPVSLSGKYAEIKAQMDELAAQALLEANPTWKRLADENDWITDDPQYPTVARVFVSNENLTWLCRNAFDFVKLINEPNELYPANPKQDVEGGVVVYFFTLPEENSAADLMLKQLGIEVFLRPS